MSGPDVLGLAEHAERLGVSPRQAHRIAARVDFPEPARITTGRVWDAAELRRTMCPPCAHDGEA